MVYLGDSLFRFWEGIGLFLVGERSLFWSDIHTFCISISIFGTGVRTMRCRLSGSLFCQLFSFVADSQMHETGWVFIAARYGMLGAWVERNDLPYSWSRPSLEAISDLRLFWWSALCWVSFLVERSEFCANISISEFCMDCLFDTWWRNCLLLAVDRNRVNIRIQL